MCLARSNHASTFFVRARALSSTEEGLRKRIFLEELTEAQESESWFEAVSLLSMLAESSKHLDQEAF
jgi:hypothetical protein